MKIDCHYLGILVNVLNIWDTVLLYEGILFFLVWHPTRSRKVVVIMFYTLHSFLTYQAINHNSYSFVTPQMFYHIDKIQALTCQTFVTMILSSCYYFSFQHKNYSISSSFPSPVYAFVYQSHVLYCV
jgi:hypothetical protein